MDQLVIHALILLVASLTIRSTQSCLTNETRIVEMLNNEWSQDYRHGERDTVWARNTNQRKYLNVGTTCSTDHCPSETVTDDNPKRYPRYIYHQQCNCSKCRLGQCQPVYRDVKVLIRGDTCDSDGYYRLGQCQPVYRDVKVLIRGDTCDSDGYYRLGQCQPVYRDVKVLIRGDTCDSDGYYRYSQKYQPKAIGCVCRADVDS